MSSTKLSLIGFNLRFLPNPTRGSLLSQLRCVTTARCSTPLLLQVHACQPDYLRKRHIRNLIFPAHKNTSTSFCSLSFCGPCRLHLLSSNTSCTRRSSLSHGACQTCRPCSLFLLHPKSSHHFPHLLPSVSILSSPGVPCSHILSI
jgi:hypothetical protein